MATAKKRVSKHSNESKRSRGNPTKDDKPQAKQRARQIIRWKPGSDTAVPGSAAPEPGKCGSSLNTARRKYEPARYCRRSPLVGRKRCRKHGGKTPRGEKSPHFKTGEHSVLYRGVLKGQLLKGYLALQTDDELISAREQIRLWTARELQLVERITDHGESAESWEEVRTQVKELEKVRKLPPSDDSAKLMDDVVIGLHALAFEGAAHESAWSDLEKCSETLRKLKQAERRKRESDHMMLSVDQVVHLFGLVATLALRCITDPPKRAEFAEGIQRLQSGEAIQLSSGAEVGRR